MAGPLRGGDGDPGAPTNNTKNVDGSPLGGSDRDPAASTINAKNVDGEAPVRQCRRSGSTAINIRKCRRWAPWEVLEPEVQDLQGML
jgi:hypothetical protein